MFVLMKNILFSVARYFLQGPRIIITLVTMVGHHVIMCLYDHFQVHKLHVYRAVSCYNEN